MIPKKYGITSEVCANLDIKDVQRLYQNMLNTQRQKRPVRLWCARMYLLLEPLVLLLGGLYVLRFGVLGVGLGILLLSLAYMRLGYLGHEIAHGQIIHSRMWGVKVWRFVFSTVLQGFDEKWWVKKHGAHHQNINIYGDEYGIDPDVDTAPFLLFDERQGGGQLERYKSRVLQGLLRWQHVTFYPLLLWMHPHWILQSFWYGGAPVRITIVLHHALMTYAIGSMAKVGFVSALMLLLLARAIGGALVGFYSVAAHVSMSLIQKSERTQSLFEHVLLTTCNQTPSRLVFWLSGGMCCQIEHHMHPKIERHELKSFHELTRACARQFGVHIQVFDSGSLVFKIPRHLKGVAARVLPKLQVQ